MGIFLKFEVEIHTDYHTGAGYGKGFNVDSAILREANGEPVIRGSTLAGLLRGGGYHLLQTEPLAAKYDREEVLERIFGSPSQPKRWYISSAHPKNPLPLNCDAQIVQRVRIDPRTRRAEPRKLFSLEEGAAGQVFEFTITCPESDEAVLDEAAFLVAAARVVRQLGRSRRRGLGECLFRLVEVKGVSKSDEEEGKDTNWQVWFLQRFKERWILGTPAKSVAYNRKQRHFPKVVQTTKLGEPKRFRLILRLDEPLIIARRSPAGQQFEARDSIPGTVILGALANEAAHRADLSDTTLYRQFISLFLRVDVYFPVLYPAYFHNNHLYPTIPAPLGLVTCSLVPFSSQNGGHGTFPAWQYQRCPECGEEKLEPTQGFIILRRLAPHVFIPHRSSEMHIAIDEATGRTHKRQLYSYTVLDVGQYFVGELQCTHEEAWKWLQVLTGITAKQPIEWRLGKARTRGYGKVTAWVEPLKGEKRDWIQLPLYERVKDPSETLSLTLLTDAIVANAWGQQAIGFSKDWLEPVLDLGPIEIVDAYVRSDIVDGFNNYLGLPRWRDTALMAGSVVRFKLLNPPKDWAERMTILERRGIGLRRNEGFGRVAFNHPVYDQLDKITESHIRLDDSMQPLHPAQRDTFAEEWKQRLGEMLPDQLDARFTALARWLHMHSDQPLKQIREILNSLGEPDKALKEALGGESEYGLHSKENFFRTDGKQDFEKLLKALKILGSDYDERHHQEGIEILANHIAALAIKKEGETL